MPGAHRDGGVMISHTCPARGCTRRVPREKLAPLDHWRVVPVPVQQEVYRAWRSGDGAAHQAAMLRAIAAMDEGVAR